MEQFAFKCPVIRGKVKLVNFLCLLEAGLFNICSDI
jgi:hypothetical protein